MSGKPVTRREKQRIARERAIDLLNDDAYASKLRSRLRAGDVAPQVEVALWHYAYGKPTDHVKVEDFREFDDDKLNDAIRELQKNPEDEPEWPEAPHSTSTH